MPTWSDDPIYADGRHTQTGEPTGATYRVFLTGQRNVDGIIWPVVGNYLHPPPLDSEDPPDPPDPPPGPCQESDSVSGWLKWLTVEYDIWFATYDHERYAIRFYDEAGFQLANGAVQEFSGGLQGLTGALGVELINPLPPNFLVYTSEKGGVPPNVDLVEIVEFPPGQLPVSQFVSWEGLFNFFGGGPETHKLVNYRKRIVHTFPLCGTSTRYIYWANLLFDDDLPTEISDALALNENLPDASDDGSGLFRWDLLPPGWVDFGRIYRPDLFPLPPP